MDLPYLDFSFPWEKVMGFVLGSESDAFLRSWVKTLTAQTPTHCYFGATPPCWV